MALRDRGSTPRLSPCDLLSPASILAVSILAVSILAVAFPAPASGSAVLVKDINPAGSSAPAMLANIGGVLYFQADDGARGTEVWNSDGSEAGTILLEDIWPGPQGSYPRSFGGHAGAIYFLAADGIRGFELWKTDGTPPGTALLEDLNPGPADSWPGSSSGFVNAGGAFFFEAYTNAAGYELWKTDGSAPGTMLVKDINAGVEGSSPLDLVEVGGTIFFRADDGLPASNHRELWRSDGTEAGTVIVRDIHPSGESYPGDLTQLGAMLLFGADDGVNGRELWRSEGTPSGTMMVKDINPTGSSRPGQLRVLNGTLFFVADDGTHGSELWRSDGTADGTVLAVDLNPSGGTAMSRLTVAGDLLFFVVPAGSVRAELWRTDGTAAGTVMLREFAPANYHPMVENLTDVNGTLFFTANDGVHGVEVWRSDGTSAGTMLAADINPGDEWSSSYPAYLTNVDGILFFSADDGVHGHELWALDPAVGAGITDRGGAAPAWSIESAPNPFTDSVQLRVDIPGAEAMHMHVAVYDASGRRLRTLAGAGAAAGSGRRLVAWDGRDEAGIPLGSGVYFLRLDGPGFERSVKVQKLR